ncbi:MAG: FAD-binding oxidoreductase [Chloroflexi bacterium]|nr:FAD-binding oxidoreductase [Chloroflexota bacterium]
MAYRTYDVILAGGGIMGCATAYYLVRTDPTLRVAIVEKDPTYARASTPLCDGNIRVQFNVKENILMSLYGLEVLARFSEEMVVGGEKPEVAFHRQGNIFLVNEEGRQTAQEGLSLQKALGCQVEWFSPDQFMRRYPLLNLTSCAGGTLGYQDGTMDPFAVLMGYKRKAVELGANFIHAEVGKLSQDRRQITGVKLTSGDVLNSNFVVNTAGAWAASLADPLGIALPVRPTKRQVFVLETRARMDGLLPAIIFPSGLYLIHERAGRFTCGKSLPDDLVSYDDFEWDRERFSQILWPELVEYVPDFDRLKVARGWAGLYEVNMLDGNAILGEWPELKGFFLANGFSGHGFQQCHAVGRYLSELILHRPISLDLSIFSPNRILENRPVYEGKHKLV